MHTKVTCLASQDVPFTPPPPWCEAIVPPRVLLLHESISVLNDQPALTRFAYEFFGLLEIVLALYSGLFEPHIPRAVLKLKVDARQPYGVLRRRIYVSSRLGQP
jgi:hypothetical protein